MTLVELLVSMFVLGIVMVIFGSVLASVQMGVVRQDRLNRTLNEARLAIEQLDREVRSGNVLYDPAAEGGSQATCSGCTAYYTLRVYTQSNADTRLGNNSVCGASAYCCTLWKIDTSGILWVRRWPPSDSASASSWTRLATGIVNRTLSEHAFELDSDALKGSRTLNVTLAVNDDYTHHPTQTTRIQAAITGRNTSYGYPSGVCSTTPSG